jgi:hypothetical protein
MRRWSMPPQSRKLDEADEEVEQKLVQWIRQQILAESTDKKGARRHRGKP